MDTINLPVLSADASIEDAMAVMRAKKRRAVVVIHPGRDRHDLYTNLQIVNALEAGKKSLRELHRSHNKVASFADPAALGAGDHTIRLGRKEYDVKVETVEARLADEKSMFGVVGTPRGKTVTVITRHETKGAWLENLPVRCRCRNQQAKHGLPRGRTAKTGDPCHTCGEPYDCA